MVQRALLCLLILAADVGAGACAGRATVSQTVQLRQKEMKEIAGSTKVIAGMFKAPDTYSAGAFEAAARDIAARAGGHLVLNFSTVAAAPGSRATDEVKSERAHFAQLSANLLTYATALESAARDHPEGMTHDMRMKPGEPMEAGLLGMAPHAMRTMSAEHAFHLMLQTCASCHFRFRERD